MSILIKTKKTADSFVVSIPTKDIQTQYLEDLITSFKAEIIAQKSKLTSEDAENLSEEIKRSWWTKNKSRILDMVAENE